MVGGGLLQIKNLTVEVGGKRVLHKVNLNVKKGETHVLLGPNGSGKTSLLLAILGIPKFKIKNGEIIFKGKDISHYPIDKRIALGIGIGFQNPPVITGVKLKDIMRVCTGGSVDVNKVAKKLNLSAFLDRDVNLGFSGGEMKRSEVAQLIAQRPCFVMLDEPDSGVDVENLELVGKEINSLLKGCSGLLITHLGHIMKYVNVDVAHVMIDGRIVCSENPKTVMDLIFKYGYKECERCLRKRRRSRQRKRKRK
jgi:Fe-S cluster assembly ATP-binding protein